jgi:hypothetical protein
VVGFYEHGNELSVSQEAPSATKPVTSLKGIIKLTS